MSFVYVEFGVDSEEHTKWRTQSGQRHAGGNRMNHAVEIAKT